MEQKICTYCGMSGHRASNCPHLKAAEACTELGIDDDVFKSGYNSLGIWLVIMIVLATAAILALLGE